MYIEQVIELLRQTKSRKDKINILKDNKDNILLQNILEYAYSPSKMFYFSKKLEHKSSSKNLFFEDMSADVFSVLDSLNQRSITGYQAEKQIRYFEGILSPLSLEIFQNIMKKDLDCGINIKTINKAYGKDFIEDFSVQLAEKYDKNRQYNTSYFYVSPKLDGIRGVFYRGNFITRNKKPILGFNHLISEFKILIEYLESTLEQNIYLIDGEIYSHENDFERIQSIVMKTKNISIVDSMSLKYNVFGFDTEGSTINADSMIIHLRNAFHNNKFHYLNLVPQDCIDNDYDQIIQKTKYYISQGYEGSMLRIPESHYSYKRSHDLIKVKFMNEMDMVILKIGPHKKYPEKAGFMTVMGKLDNGKEVICDVAVSQKEHQDTFLYRSDLIGKKIEVHYQNITADGSIRFPVFKKFKLDR